MTIGEKVTYIKGLCEGLNKDDKIIDAILDVLSDIAENLKEVDEELDDVASVMTDLEESVCDLEDEIYGEDDYDEDIWTARVGVTYDVNRYVSVFGRLEYQTEETEGGGARSHEYDYDRWRGTVGVSLTY